MLWISAPFFGWPKSVGNLPPVPFTRANGSEDLRVSPGGEWESLHACHQVSPRATAGRLQCATSGALPSVPSVSMDPAMRLVQYLIPALSLLGLLVFVGMKVADPPAAQMQSFADAFLATLDDDQKGVAVVPL